MAASRRTPRAVSVSRAATPSDAGSDSWNGTRLRPRQSSLDTPGLSPTKVTRTAASRTTGSKRLVKVSSVGGSVSQSVAESETGSVDPTTGLRRNTGDRSRNARPGTNGNSYGAVVDAQSSQMDSEDPNAGLSRTLDTQLQQENGTQRVEVWRVRTHKANLARLLALSAVREDSEEMSGKSFGPSHEHGMGHTASRPKSFSDDHEGGIANHIQRQPTGKPGAKEDDDVSEHSRFSATTHTSMSVRLDTPENLLPWEDRARIWYNGHKNIIRSVLSLLGLLLFGFLFGQALWDNVKYHLTSPKLLPDGSMPPTVTVTSHVHSHMTTTVTEIIKETSVVAPLPSMQERRNVFNMEVGAKIDPRLTSITRAPMTLLNSVLAPLSGKWFPGPIVNQADIALKHWTETGQSWCAASSDLGQGQLQLGVSLPFTVRPLAVTLEHQLEHLSFDPSNSARHVELWIESHEDSTGANVNNDCGPRPEGMDEFWFCVAKMEFGRFNGEEKSQRIEFRNEHMFTKHFAFRVLDNWGSDHTCLYRLQMHGQLKRERNSGGGA
ncbi:hypothetical protein Vi05172_g13721 [Venturia inaequalis]|nr:hypothetical protein Vi05172_g13721 [Venturia inaequalis]